jgi:hypothetical protein
MGNKLPLNGVDSGAVSNRSLNCRERETAQTVHCKPDNAPLCRVCNISQLGSTPIVEVELGAIAMALSLANLGMQPFATVARSETGCDIGSMSTSAALAARRVD